MKSSLNDIVLTLLIPLCLALASCQSRQAWIPSQNVPQNVISVVLEDTLCPEEREKMHILVQSVSGLAAKAVNEGRGDTMVWIQVPGPDYDHWYEGTLARLNVSPAGTLSAWELVERFHAKGLFTDYILYSYDTSEGPYYEQRESIDHSANVATTLAGPMNAILIDESMEPMAIQLGLRRGLDVRGKDMQWCYVHHRDKLNRNILFTLDPKVGHNRALAVAHNGAVVFGVGKTTAKFLEWTTPPAPIFGWNYGDESEHTRPVTEYGHFQTASNWAFNLPFLSAGADTAAIEPIDPLNPNTINFDDDRQPVGFIVSDGDNLQWLMGNFCFHRDYWANPYHGKFPVGWTICSAHLAQSSPETMRYLAQTKPPHTSLIEYGGGYYYPDLFAKNRPDRLQVLTTHARRISAQLKRTGATIFGFICKDVGSSDAMDAYKVFAEHIEGLIGMVAIQYYPYEGGHGKIFWVKNAEGVEIPVITATHTLWSNANWPTGGTPAKIARLINEEVRGDGNEARPFNLVAVHSWSYFKDVPDADDDAENFPPDASYDTLQTGGRGLTPIQWCIDRLDPEINVVSIEEIIWRLRMQYDPVQTRRVMSSLD